MVGMGGFRSATALGLLIATLSSPAIASTGCDSANNGDYDGSASLVALDLNLTGDFDENDVLHFTTNSDTLLFVLANISHVTLLTWIGAHTDDYTITTTGSQSFLVALTATLAVPPLIPGGNATLAVTCTAAPPSGGGGGDPGGGGGGDPGGGGGDPGGGGGDPGGGGGGDPGGGGGGGDPPPGPDGSVLGALVDRLLAGGLWGAQDQVQRQSRATMSNIRREYLGSQLEMMKSRVVALELLHALDPADTLVNRKLETARRIVDEVSGELGALNAPAVIPPQPIQSALQWVSPETTGAMSPATNAASLVALGNGMAFRMRLSPELNAAVTYRQMQDTGGDGMRGWTVTGTQSLNFPSSGKLSGGLFGTFRYSTIGSPDGVNHTETTGYGVGAHSELAIGQNLSLRASAAYEHGTNTAAIDDAFGTFGSDRFEGVVDLGGSAWMGAFRFAPHVGVSYAERWRQAYTDSASTLIPKGHSRLATLSAGGEIAYSSMMPAWPSVITFHPFLNGGVEWTFLRDNAELTEDFDTAAIVYRGGGGVRLYWGPNAWFAMSGTYFIGGSAEGYEASAELNLPLFYRGPNVDPGTLRLTAAGGSAGASATARAILPLQ